MAILFLLILNNPILIPEATEIKVRLLHTLNSDLNSVGDAVALTVLEDVTIEHQVAIPKGTEVKGKITKTVPRQQGKVPGHIAFTIVYIDLPSKRIIVDRETFSAAGASRGTIGDGLAAYTRKGFAGIIPAGAIFEVLTKKDTSITPTRETSENKPIPQVLHFELKKQIEINSKVPLKNKPVFLEFNIPKEHWQDIKIGNGANILNVNGYDIPEWLESRGFVDIKKKGRIKITYAPNMFPKFLYSGKHHVQIHLAENLIGEIKLVARGR